jgi:transposase
MKLKDMVNEADDQWRVKDIIEMQKAHEKILRAAVAMSKATKKLNDICQKHQKKPNGQLFRKEAGTVHYNFENSILNTSSKFWKAWEDIRKSGKAAFPNNWN